MKWGEEEWCGEVSRILKPNKNKLELRRGQPGIEADGRRGKKRKRVEDSKDKEEKKTDDVRRKDFEKQKKVAETKNVKKTKINKIAEIKNKRGKRKMCEKHNQQKITSYFSRSYDDTGIGVGVMGFENRQDQAKPVGGGGSMAGGGTDGTGERGGGPIESLNLKIRPNSGRMNNDGGGKSICEAV